jgi:DNA-binding transcriptional MocR family regulator
MRPSAKTEGTLVEAVTGAIQARLDARQLVPGARIPSVRAFAETMGVSKSTVVEAYERLAAEGVIASRPGSGFYVAGRTRPLVLKAVEPQPDRAVDPLWITRQSLQAGPELLKPGSGWLPDDWMPEVAIRRHLRQLANAPDTNVTCYDKPLGHAPLRAQIARRLDEKSIAATPDQIILVDSATQALELLCRFLIQPGDTVVVDDPCYFNFLALLRSHRVQVVGVPFTPDGPDIAAFAAILAVHRPRFYLTNAALHNPTGATLTPAVVHRVLKLCEAHDVLIVEDDIWGDLEHAPAPRLAGFDGLQRVVHIGSFSKTLSAALRCGWIAVRADWIEPLVDLKLALSLGNGPFAATLAHRFLVDGASRHHLAEVRRKLAGAMTRTMMDLRRCGLELWTEPSAGFFLWARLPDRLDAADVARIALRRGVVLAPGGAFSLSPMWNGFLRFNAAHCADPKIFAVLRKAMAEAKHLPAE